MKREIVISMISCLIGASSVIAYFLYFSNSNVTHAIKKAPPEMAGAAPKEASNKEELIDLGKDVKLALVLLPEGKFKMGFTKKEMEDFKVAAQEDIKKAFEKELGEEELEKLDLMMSLQGKQHEVTLTKPYYMGKYEVTEEQWESVMGKNLRSTVAKYPLTEVSWNDCQEFIQKLNAKTDGGYRLPTEAEWEYACRGGTSTAYSFGEEITPKDSNYFDSKLRKPMTECVTAAVGTYKPNAFGLYDMHGNVYEWCNDWHGSLQDDDTMDPKGPSTGTNRVLRGGSFNYTVSEARSSNRAGLTQTKRYKDVGFRLARTP